MLCRYFSEYFEIRVAYHSSFDTFIEKEQLTTFHCKALNPGSAIQGLKKMDFSWLSETALEEVYLDQVSVIKKYQPAAILGDHSPTLKMAAESTSVIFISLLNGYISKYYAGQRSISGTHAVYPFLKMLPRSLEIWLTKFGEASAFRMIHKPFKRIRDRYKLQKLNTYLDELEGDLNLVCDLEYLFPQKKLPSTYHVITPLFYESPVTVHPHSFIRDQTKKTIWASMGSTGDWQNIAFLNDPFFEKYNVVATGDDKRVLHAKHITHLQFINIHELLPLTDLVICHGGNGTISQALLYRIPVLCKTSHCEQEWNIDALEKKHLGKTLDRIKDLQQYKIMVEEWIVKKGNDSLKLCSEKIEEARIHLPQTIKQVAENILMDLSRFEKIGFPLGAVGNSYNPVYDSIS